MKKFVKTAAIVMTLALSLNYSFAAATENVNGQILNSFHQDFKDAQLIKTDVLKTFSKLTFEVSGNVMSAFYSNSGELLAVTRNILSSQLPLNLMSSLKKHETSAWITDLFEFKSDDQDVYYVTIENADSKVVLRSNGSEWETYSSTKK